MLRAALATGLAALVLAPLASAATAPAFLGCYDSQGIPIGTANLVTSARTQADCNTVCSQYAFSYFMVSQASCYCDNGAPDPRRARLAASLSACADTDYTANKLATSYTFQQCAATMKYWDTPTMSAQASVYECMRWCAASNNRQYWVFAVYYPGGNPAGGSTATTPWCQCSTSTSYTQVPCGPNTAYNYNLERLAAASWVVRRDQAHRLDARAVRRSLSMCPYPLDACVTSPGAGKFGGYECLDTASELESCGGCRYGALAPANGTDAAAVAVNYSVRGTDCAALPGVARGAVSCVDGTCKVSACRTGWTLVNSGCLPA